MIEPHNVQLRKIKNTEEAITFFENKIAEGFNEEFYRKEVALLIAKTNSENYLSPTDQQEI